MRPITHLKARIHQSKHLAWFLCSAFLLMGTYAFAQTETKEVLTLGGASFTSDTLQVSLIIDSNYHVIANEPGDEFLIPFEAELICDTDTLTPIYPKAKSVHIPELGINANWFTESIPLKFTGCNSKAPILNVYYQACTEKTCLPPKEVSFKDFLSRDSHPLSASLKSAPAPKATPIKASAFLLLLFLAFVGGLILNFMPCVLPVISLKVFSLIKETGDSKRHNILSGVSFALGILVSFWSISAILITMQFFGHKAGWGFQFTYPGFVFFIFLVVLIFGLNLLGLFEISLSYKTTTALDSKGQQSGYAGSFFKGVFMTLLSTPCSAPFLGTSMGYALSQPPVVLVLFFTAAGLGLAFPFLLLSFFPQWVKYLPRPGAWMNRLKEVMGFILLVTGVWLLSIIAAQKGNDIAFNILQWSLILSLLLWVWHHWGEGLQHSMARKAKVSLFILIAALSSGYLLVAPLFNENVKNESHLQFTKESVNQLTSAGHWVFVDYTAEWCLSCKVNEKSTINNAEVQEYFKREKPLFMKGDYTSGNPEIDKELRRVGRAGVPLYILYGPNGQEHVFPEILTPEMLLEKFKAIP